MQTLSVKNFTGVPPINSRFENLAAAPGTALGLGHTYFDTTAGFQLTWNGSAWINPLARANHTGTQAASTISNLAATVQAYRLDQFAAPTAPVAFGNQRVTGVGTPTTAGDAAEYSWVIGQVQAAAAGITSRPPVRAVATGNLTLSGTQTVDGVALAAGDRVLATAQTTASGNGVYVVAAGAWSRATAEDQASELTAGAMWLVTEGTTYAGTQWRQATTGTITVGTTNLSILQFSAGGGYTAGNGVTITGGVIAIKLPASSGLVSDGTGLYLDPAVAVRKYAATIGDGSATSYTVTHSLGTKDVTVSTRYVSSDAACEVDWTASSTTAITLTFASAPAASSIRVVVHG